MQQENRRALAFYFFTRICYIFSKSKCGEESDPSRIVHNFGTCKKHAAARPGGGNFWQILRPKTCFNWKSPLRSRILFSSPKIVHRPRSNSSLNIDIGIHCKFILKKRILALGICFPQPCSSAGRTFPQIDHVLTKPTNWFVSTKTNSSSIDWCCFYSHGWPLRKQRFQPSTSFLS